MMITDGIGLYVHVPFCISKCKYCDFASRPNISGDVRRMYVAHLITEIKSYRKEEKIKINTVFFGGGTPSLLTCEELTQIFCAIKDTFDLSRESEITLEANPKTLTREKLESFLSLGVNRISIGLQSIHKNELEMLGRIHNFDDFLESYSLVREVGFDNVSVDLMYGIPGQTLASFSKTLDTIISLKPEHVSAYGLIIEEGTPFYEMKDNLPLPSEDEECDMYSLACEKLAANGYHHYEISNYAKAGCLCRHNLKYWRDEEFLGVGLAAYSYFDGKRFGNTRSFSEYLSPDYTKYRYVEDVSGKDEMFEYAMMRLRLSEGISLSNYEKRFGISFVSGREDIIAKYKELGYLFIDADRLCLTDMGFYISNSIISDLL